MRVTRRAARSDGDVRRSRPAAAVSALRSRPERCRSATRRRASSSPMPNGLVSSRPRRDRAPRPFRSPCCAPTRPAPLPRTIRALADHVEAGRSGRPSRRDDIRLPRRRQPQSLGAGAGDQQFITVRSSAVARKRWIGGRPRSAAAWYAERSWGAVPGHRQRQTERNSAPPPGALSGRSCRRAPRRSSCRWRAQGRNRSGAFRCAPDGISRTRVPPRQRQALARDRAPLTRDSAVATAVDVDRGAGRRVPRDILEQVRQHLLDITSSPGTSGGSSGRFSATGCSREQVVAGARAPRRPVRRSRTSRAQFDARLR